MIFCNKNGGVCKKLELNIVKIDQGVAILSSKKVFQKILIFQTKFVPLWKIAIVIAIFPCEKNFSNFRREIHKKILILKLL